jgi:hypothetical protein
MPQPPAGYYYLYAIPMPQGQAGGAVLPPAQVVVPPVEGKAMPMPQGDAAMPAPPQPPVQK